MSESHLALPLADSAEVSLIGFEPMFQDRESCCLVRASRQGRDRETRNEPKGSMFEIVLQSCILSSGREGIRTPRAVTLDCFQDNAPHQ